jgi:hypothetical protein
VNLEDQLRAALRRQEPPDGFAERVLARLPDKPVRRPAAFAGIGPWLAMAAVLVLVFAGALSWRSERERRQMAAAQQAKQELIYALELTTSELQETRVKLLRRIGGGNTI